MADVIGLIIAAILIAYLFLASFLAFEELDWTDMELGYDEQRDRESEERNREPDPAVLEQD